MFVAMLATVAFACSEGFFGPPCLPCLPCAAGTCNDGVSGDGTCVCPVGNVGFLCETTVPYIESYESPSSLCSGSGVCISTDTTSFKLSVIGVNFGPAVSTTVSFISLDPAAPTLACAISSTTATRVECDVTATGTAEPSFTVYRVVVISNGASSSLDARSRALAFAVEA